MEWMLIIVFGTVLVYSAFRAVTERLGPVEGPGGSSDERRETTPPHRRGY